MAYIDNIMIERHNLIRAFNILKEHRVIAVCAPAGYGKTVAVSQWLNRDARAKGMLSLDEYDNNLAGFCERFCAALVSCQPQNKTFSEIVSHKSFQSAPDEFTLRAISALSSRKRAVLAIDDLHLIDNAAIMQILLVIIKRLPKNFQIVLISRHDLPLALSELCIKGIAARVNAEQFLFDSDDIKALYTKRGSSITQEQARDIARNTRGWVMGINAFLLSGKESFDVAYKYLDDFIQANIWDKWDESTRYFMIHTAALRELTPELCEVMTGITNGDKFLKELVQKGAFITQIQDGVYRYHHLFHQFLRRMAEECGDKFLLPLWEKEGYWHMSNSDYFSAFNCFLRSKNHESIARCFGALVDIGDSDVVLAKIMPIAKHPEFIAAAKKYPFMLFMSAFCALAEGRAETMVSVMDEYYARHPEIAEKWPDTSYKIIYMFSFDFRVSLEQLSNVFGGVPATAATVNTSVIRWSVTMHMPMLHRAVRDYSELATFDTAESVRAQSVKTGWMIGEEEPLFHAALTAGLLYEQGQLEKAHEYATKAIAYIKSHYTAEKKFCAFSILICILDALGDTKAACRVLESVLAMIEEDKAYYLSHNANDFILRRKFAQGDTQAANDRIKTHKQTFEESTVWGIYSSLTSCRAFISAGEYSAAIVLLQKNLEIANAFNRTCDIIDAQILLAIACHKNKRGFQHRAIKHLEQAVITAYPYGYIQMFINEGAELYAIFFKLQKSIEQRKDRNVGHLSFIKMLYLKTDTGKSADLTKQKAIGNQKFTDRQKMIMHLLCQHKTQKDIAETLGIKQVTLRTHLNSIYAKLEVANALDAIKKISEVNLLELMNKA